MVHPAHLAAGVRACGHGGFGPGRSTLTLAGLIYNEGLQNLNLGYASSVAIVLFVIIMAVTLIQLRLLRTNWEY